MNTITSRDNQWIKLACSLKYKKGRLDNQCVFVEGMRIVVDAADNGLHDAVCFVSPKESDSEEFLSLYEKGNQLGWTFFAVTDSVYDKIKDTKSPQGIAAMIPFFDYTFSTLPSIDANQVVVYLQEIQDPGNLGTILRTAAAANAGAVFLSEGSVDVYNDKTIRGAMGAIFKIPVIQGVTEEELQSFCASQGRTIYGTAASGTVSYEKADYNRPVVAFGNEGNGLCDDFLKNCGEVVTIPMCSNTESLNLSMSVGLILYKIWECHAFNV